eukprot:SAG31_NODE_104_length_25069_cov_12.917144_19_plen_121_part_00
MLPLCNESASMHARTEMCCSCRKSRYVLLWQLPPSRQWATILLLVVNSFGYSWCGVVLYSMTAEKARLDPVEGAAILNTMQWGWYSLGGLLGDIIAGPWQVGGTSDHGTLSSTVSQLSQH